LRSPVEIVAPTSGRLRLDKLLHDAIRLRSLQNVNKDLIHPFIVVVGKTSSEAKDWTEGKFNLKIWDFDVLQEKARPSGDLYKDFEKLAQAEVERRAAGTTTLEGQNDRDESANLIQQLKENEKNGGLSSSEYERLCLTVFTFLFDPHLYGFQLQAETTDGGNRYDFVCRIRSGNAFWDSIRTDFKTRSIIFECKITEIQ
jgi:hypothetical protein